VLLTMIKVRPAPDRRAAFARWATAQSPQVETCSHSEFAVPPGMFTHMPEELLIGSLVDGHRYVSPQDDEGRDLLGVATEEAFTPNAPAPDFAPLEDAPTPDDDGSGVYACDLCPRTFPTERGRNTHRRQAHPKGDS
jgi:hypothetical protein